MIAFNGHCRRRSAFNAAVYASLAVEIGCMSQIGAYVRGTQRGAHALSGEYLHELLSRAKPPNEALERFHDGCNALAAADALGCERVAALGAGEQ
jgi:hypothetical protein